MTISLLATKTFLVPACGTIAAGASCGGAYYVYSTKYATNSSTGTAAAKPISTNSFLVRVKTTGTHTISADNPTKCTIAPNKEVDCKIFKFTTAKTNNSFTAFSSTTLTEVTTNGSDLLANNYVVVELKDATVTFDAIKNKTISLKSGTNELTKLDFDQLLVKTNEANATASQYAPIPAVVETYIVSIGANTPTTADASTSPLTGFRCKYKDTNKTTDIDNYDDSCSLSAIPAPDSNKHITTLEKVKSEQTPVTDLAASTYYKLTLDKNKLYNLDFESSTATLSVELTVSTNNKTAPLNIHQKLVSDKFIGKTDLLLAKFVATTTPSTYTGRESKCSFNADGNQDTSNQFPCNLHVANPTADTDIPAISITTTAAPDSTTLTADHIFGIKLTTPKALDDLSVGKTIYIHTKPTSGASAVTHKFEIKTLLSGSIAAADKAFIIA